MTQPEYDAITNHFYSYFQKKLKEGGIDTVGWNAVTAHEFYQKVSDDDEKELTPEALAKFFGKRDAPDAIFSLNWVASMGALRALRSLQGFGSLAFISFDDFELAEMLSPALTVVRQPSAEMGRIAAELLFERLTGGRTVRKNVVLTTEFHIRQSCGCR